MSKFGPKPRTLEDIFLSGVIKTDGCWIWGKSKVAGYGQIGHRENGRLVHKAAHRVSYELYKGPIPDGMLVCHSCDNRYCVAPDHLWLGTYADNSHDAVEKGRNAHGERTANAKLTDSKVFEITEHLIAGKAKSEIAKMYGVTDSLIVMISKGKRWKHVVGKESKKIDGMWNRNRSMSGENANRSKLTNQDAMEILRAYTGDISMKEIGVKYGVSKSAIFNVVHGKTKFLVGCP